MKQPEEKLVKAQENDLAGVDKEAILSEEDTAKVNAGATTGGSVIFVRLPPFEERS